MSGVPYTFGTATTSIPLSNLDSNFVTPVTIGNASVALGNTITSIGNLTLTNPTIIGGTSNVTSTSISNGTSNVAVLSSNSNVTSYVNGVLQSTLSSSGLSLTGSLNSINTFGFKNRLINGNGIIYQRASSAALTTTASYVSCDRWFAGQETAAASTFGISSTGLGVGFAQQMALNRNNGSTGTGRIYAGQIIESNNLLDLQGKTVTFSFTARAGTNFSATSSSIQVQVYSGTTADQGLTSLQAGSWAGLTAILDTTQVITTTNTTYSFTASVPSGCKELAVYVRFTPTGTAGADDTLYFTNAQFEVGLQTTSFDFRSIGTELALCQRYYVLKNCVVTTSSANQSIHLPSQMRTYPTIGTVSFESGTGAVFSSASGASVTVSPSFIYQSANHSTSAVASIPLSAEL